MDEFDVVLRARRFISEVGLTDIPVKVEQYVQHVGATLRYATDLSVPGYTLSIGDKKIITIEEKDSIERQRFTICHEVAHLSLEIPTEHSSSNYPSGYIGRSRNEIFCDVFAAALLLPDGLFKPLADVSEIGFSAVDRLADQFKASRMAVASRFAAVNFRPCAYVLAEKGMIRYVSYSPLLREWKAWIRIGGKIPTNSLAARTRLSSEAGPLESDPTVWFDDWQRGGILFEDARRLSRWDQTLSLLWFEEDEIPQAPKGFDKYSGDEEYKELDGILPWPGKKKRR